MNGTLIPLKEARKLKEMPAWVVKKYLLPAEISLLILNCTINTFVDYSLFLNGTFCLFPTKITLKHLLFNILKIANALGV